MYVYMMPVCMSLYEPHTFKCQQWPGGVESPGIGSFKIPDVCAEN